MLASRIMLDVLFNLLVLVIAVSPIPAVVASVYLWSVYLADKRRPRSWLVRMLATTSTIVTVAAVYFGSLAVVRLTGHAGDLPDWFGIVSAAVVLALDVIPVYKAFVIYRASHGGSQPRIQA